MFIGHLPGAYLIFRTATPDVGKLAFAAAMLGAVAPDLDMLWFYLVDNRAHHHHAYLTHRPIVWVALLFAGLALRLFYPKAGTVLAFFGAGGVVHMALDSIVGKIAWAWPYSDYSQPLVVVQATHSHWILSFLNHWTFAVELAITALAIALWLWRRRNSTCVLSSDNG
ncbi:metal-dependent hydrolase [Roseibium sp. RKSG952]|uniref:metal-dependent hydrolase n=1 Tax=Roseibium sp. RKSG952 TaxID=2529384 RepID=UPI0012BBB585|nr:metal-dependent hydrolase [Roseibium sp. RKSG952]MTH98643.1 metal-dependent hydrolase [Roseibium sp. RKSG952]